MRNPHFSIEKQPKAKELGGTVRELLTKAVELWPQILEVSRAILEGKQPQPWSQDITEAVR